MDEAQGSSSILPPFVSKTYKLVNDPSTNSIVFKHANFASFVRQLNGYGFRKVKHDKWEFVNDDFVRDQPDLLKNIHRRQPVHSRSMQNIQGHGVTPLPDSERQSLEDEIAKLKHENEQLLLKREEDKKMYETQMLSSNHQLAKLEKRQQDTLSSVTQVLQKSGIALNLSPLMEKMGKKQRLLPRSGHVSDEAGTEGPMETSQVSPRENTSLLSLNLEQIEQLESSMQIWENIAQGIGDAFVQGHWKSEFDESIGCAEIPAISSELLDVEVQAISRVLLDSTVQPESSGINMNCEPSADATPDLVASQDQPVGTDPVATGFTDAFWEQFFPESPTVGQKRCRQEKE
ncbi:hypothetical protein RIF29_40408 [Crotalaria pallida]|uniref:HSF-type DNA-binding domain-containing protein n=1 Tax=Crotalaria pallida TaxID=3830 RepID=A0AAN9E4P5_CROPI